MANGQIIPVPEDFAAKANIRRAEYDSLYEESISDPEGFWARMAAERLSWFRPWDKVLEHDFGRGQAAWFLGGQLNAAWNCLDRHLPALAGKTAIIWEGDNPAESRTLTYAELHREACRLANVLKRQGVQRGDRVIIYLPMIPELAISVLACARIGAIHSVVFGGFSPEALIDRIDDCKPALIITSDGGYRGGRLIEMKSNVDTALERADTRVEAVLVVRRTGAGGHGWTEGRDRWLDELLADPEISDSCEAEVMDAEDPLFILYTSGSTGKPKGVLHTTGGYLLGASLTHHYVFDHKPEDIYWCTADIGWVTGHSYIIYGPLANGATTLMFEGVPTYPDAGRFWDVVDKYQVTVFYTAPTAIRALSREGLDHVRSNSLASLRLLGSVGEPINPEAWLWYWRNIGKERCPVVDTWWQTETGSILITPLPGAIDLKPGSATVPFFGVRPVLVDSEGNRLPDSGEATGNLCIEFPWPSMMRGVYGEPERMYMTYFSQFPGLYFSGDGATRDADGYWWVTGRVDDVLNVAGHRIGSAEVESALVGHEAVAEAAVVAYPHDIKGQGIYAYVTLHQGYEPSDGLRTALVETVADKISKIARPDIVHWTPALPKTRSGKIMRRVLRKIAEREFDNLGDTSTLADPSVVQTLIEERAKYEGAG
ncbi:MAG: acetate--CoA ligase [Dehalococcoidia bacterium]|nr:acetate--CoA ligase [Dehalococcoidia bacterium]